MKGKFLAIGLASFTLAIASLTHPAQAVSLDCGKDLVDFNNNLERIDRQIETWTQTKLSKDQSLDFKNPQVRDSLIFTPHAISDSVSFIDFYRDCWTMYVDFQRALANKSRSDANRDLYRWQSCVGALKIEVTELYKKVTQCAAVHKLKGPPQPE